LCSTKAGYICADHPVTFVFRLRQSGGPYIPVGPSSTQKAAIADGNEPPARVFQCAVDANWFFVMCRGTLRRPQNGRKAPPVA
jgi:hypothetical protein